MENTVIQYRFTLADGSQEVYDLELDGQSLALIGKVPDAKVGVLRQGRMVAAGPAEKVRGRETDPALGPVKPLCRHSPVFRHARKPVGQRVDGLRKIAQIGRPVVHLQVDVQVKVGLPRGPHPIVPDPL